MEVIREESRKNNYKFPLTVKIANIHKTYQYNQWKKYKEDLIQILLKGINWCEDSLLTQSENPNWCDLLEKYHTLLYKFEIKGLNPDESKVLYKTFLTTKANIKEKQYKIWRKHGISDGQACSFYLPTILEIYLEIHDKFGGFEAKIHEIRQEILECQKNSASEGYVIEKKLVITQEELDLFLTPFQGSLNAQFENFCNILLPNFDNILLNLTNSDDMRFYFNSVFFEDNIYGDRIIKGNLSEKNQLIEHFSKDKLQDEYERFEFLISKLFIQWREIEDFKIKLVEYFKDTWFYLVRIPFIEKIISYFAESDYVGFFHLILPQIEGILRDLLHFNKISIYREKRKNISIQEYLLAGEIIPVIRRSNLLNSDLIILIELYLFDPLYKSLRHNTLHGFHDIRIFDEHKANMLLLILFKLSRSQKTR